ncbi:hypothetical protein JTB14_007706 [Gonioctena quinquepunctata]|nr:hypothetical protein JTB14_007706 [Gonioctena quinquepunctata]
MSRKFNLTKITSEEAFDLLGGITEEQAINSDLEGDSDAEDISIARAPGSPRSTFSRSSVSSLHTNKENITQNCIGVPGEHSEPSCSRAIDQVNQRSLNKRKLITADYEKDSDDSITDPNWVDEVEMPYSLQSDELDVSSGEEEDNHPINVTNPKYTFTKDPVKPSAFDNYCFQEPYGPTFNVNIDKPSDIFQHFMSDDIMQRIVSESNKYAKQNGTDLELNVEELISFIGLLIIMGFHSLPSMRRYWSTDPNFSVPRITKVWVITDAKTGYMLKFSVYEGKSTGSVDDTLGARVVKDLSEKYIDKGYCLYFDNFFSTFDLVKGLLEKKTFRSDRERYPRELLRSEKQIKKGDSDYAFHGENSFTKWKDPGQKSVILLSSFHDP